MNRRMNDYEKIRRAYAIDAIRPNPPDPDSPPPETPAYQSGRTHRRVSITLPPEALGHADAIRRETGLLHLSAVIAWALERAASDPPAPSPP